MTPPGRANDLATRKVTVWVKGRSLPGGPLISTADKSKSCRDSSAARRGRFSKVTAEVQTSFARGGTKSSAEARHKRAPRCFTHRGPRVSRRRRTPVNQFSRANA